MTTRAIRSFLSRPCFQDLESIKTRSLEYFFEKIGHRVGSKIRNDLALKLNILDNYLDFCKKNSTLDIDKFMEAYYV